MAPETPDLRQRYGLKPELSISPGMSHVDVRRLAPLHAEEEEPIPTNPQQRWHCATLPLEGSIEKAYGCAVLPISPFTKVLNIRMLPDFFFAEPREKNFYSYGKHLQSMLGSVAVIENFRPGIGLTAGLGAFHVPLHLYPHGLLIFFAHKSHFI